MANPVPITFTALPAPTGIEAVDFNQLVGLIAQYLQGSISQSVSFFLQGSNFPSSNQGLFYNQTTQQFGAWNNALGRYVPLTTDKVGDAKPCYVAGDDAVNGWIQLDGRNVNSVPGITVAQKANLETLFGAGGTMPTANFGATTNNGCGKVYVGAQ